MKRKFYQISTADRVASIDIYGDITSWNGTSQMSAHQISRKR